MYLYSVIVIDLKRHRSNFAELKAKSAYYRRALLAFILNIKTMDLLTVQAVAVRLHSHPNTVRDAIKKGHLEASYRMGKYLITEAALQEYLAAELTEIE